MTEAHTAHTSSPKPWDVVNGLRGVTKGHKSGEIVFSSAGHGNSGDRRGIVSGDYVRVVPVEAPQFMFEAQMAKMTNPMVIKPIDRVDLEHILKHATPSTVFRMEKLANRVS